MKWLAAIHLTVVLGVCSSLAAAPPIMVSLQAGEPQSAIVDPLLQKDQIYAIARVAGGRVFVLAQSHSPAFPQASSVPDASGYRFVARVAISGDAFDAVMRIDSTVMTAPAALAVDAAGDVYVAGYGLLGNPNTAFGGAGGSGVALAKLDGSLERVIFKVVIGGGGIDRVSALFVDPSGNSYIAGSTTSTDFPITPGCLQPIKRSLDATGFVSAISSSGTSLRWSTYLGGSSADLIRAIAPAAGGGVFVAGWTSSSDFPTSPGAFQRAFHTNPDYYPPQDGFVSWINATGTVLTASTYLGGAGADAVNSLAGNQDGSVSAAGTTNSADFPLTIITDSPAAGEQRGFATRLKANLTGLVFSELVGGVQSQAAGLAPGAQDSIVVVGSTSGGLATVRAPQPVYHGSMCTQYSPSGVPYRTYQCPAGFVTILDVHGAVSASTYLNGYYNTQAKAVSVDGGGNVIVGGAGVLSFSGKATAATSGNAFLARWNTALAPPLLSAQSVTNGASFGVGLPRPGSLATIFCSGLQGISGVQDAGFPLPLSFLGISVTVGGKPAPIFAAAELNGYQQINIQVPWDIDSSTETGADVVVSQGDVSVWVIQADFLTSSPGVFTIDGVSGAIQHADYSLVTSSHPAAPGEIILVYATGLGPVTEAPKTGEAAPVVPLARTTEKPSVTVAGVPAEVQFSGLAPGYVGLYQLNVRLPDSLPSGAQDLIARLPSVVAAKPPSFQPLTYDRVGAAVKIAIR